MPGGAVTFAPEGKAVVVGFFLPAGVGLCVPGAWAGGLNTGTFSIALVRRLLGGLPGGLPVLGFLGFVLFRIAVTAPEESILLPLSALSSSSALLRFWPTAGAAEEGGEDAVDGSAEELLEEPLGFAAL